YLRDSADLQVDIALRVQQALAAGSGIEHCLAHFVVAAVSAEALFRPIVNTRCTERGKQKPDRADHLIIARSVGEAAAWLPERIVIVDKRDQVPADFSAVQCALPLGLNPI